MTAKAPDVAAVRCCVGVGDKAPSADPLSPDVSSSGEAAQDSKEMSEEDGAPVMADDESKVSPELQVLRCVMQLDKSSYDACQAAVERLQAAVKALCEPSVPTEARKDCLADMFRLLAGLFKLRGDALDHLMRARNTENTWLALLRRTRAWAELCACLCRSYAAASFVAGNELCPTDPKAAHVHDARCHVMHRSLSLIDGVLRGSKWVEDEGLITVNLTKLYSKDLAGVLSSHELAGVERSMYTTLANMHDYAIVAAAAGDTAARDIAARDIAAGDIAARDTAARKAAARKAAARNAAARDAVAPGGHACTKLPCLTPHVPNAALVEMTTLLGELVRPVCRQRSLTTAAT